MSRNLSRLLKPKSIALFGGSWAENVLVQLQKSSFAGKIWPVHPSRNNMLGIPCYRSVDELPEPPDASFVGVNRNLTIGIVRRLSEMGAGGATCFASGFLESGQEDITSANLQQELVDAAGDMPILGPNCYGLLNYLDNITLWPDQHGGRPVERGVAIIGQSSNVLINMTMQKRGLPISHVVAAGNQAQTGLSNIAASLLEDGRVSAIGLYIEGFGDIRELEQFASRAHEMGKPVVALKTGKSEKSRLATMTHTASLAGNAVASSALMRRLGFVEVNSVAVFLETLKILHLCGPLHGNAVSSMSCSGGEAGLVADMADKSSIHFRGFSEAGYRKLKQVLGPMVSVANPLDYHTYIWNDEDLLFECYRAVLEDRFDLNVLIMDMPHETRCDASAWEGPLRAICRARESTNAPTALLATLPENLSEQRCDELVAAGIVPLLGMEEMIEAIDAAIRAGEYQNLSTSPALQGTPGPDNMPGIARSAIALDEASSKNELSSYGLHFPKAVLANTPQQIREACSKLSFPLVLKGVGIAHKSEAGAVKTALNSPDEVLEAAENMPGLSRFLVEEMVTSPLAELIIGITRDETGLFLLTLGAGGIMTELLDDTVSLIIPSSRDDIGKALARLKISKVLRGYRGKPSADINALLDAVEAVQDYCIHHPDLIELDVNPLMALEHGAVAVDALIVKGASL